MLVAKRELTVININQSQCIDKYRWASTCPKKFMKIELSLIILKKSSNRYLCPCAKCKCFCQCIYGLAIACVALQRYESN